MPTIKPAGPGQYATMLAMHLAGLHCYPVKSCRGISLRAADVAATGLAYDRSFMVVRPDGEFLTQRELPALATVATAIDAGQLTVTAPGGSSWSADLAAPSGTPMPVEVFDDRLMALDQGDEPAELFSAHLHRPVRLVRVRQTRAVPESAAPPGSQVGFADAYPLLLASESSLADLNERMPAPLPMERFRPNLVVSGAPPFAEDSWRHLRVGDLDIDLVKPCARCTITTVDQETGLRDGAEPLRTLGTFRRGKKGVEFGWNCVPRATGRVQVGDEVTVVSTASG